MVHGPFHSLRNTINKIEVSGNFIHVNKHVTRLLTKLNGHNVTKEIGKHMYKKHEESYKYKE